MNCIRDLCIMPCVTVCSTVMKLQKYVMRDAISNIFVLTCYCQSTLHYGLSISIRQTNVLNHWTSKSHCYLSMLNYMTGLDLFKPFSSSSDRAGCMRNINCVPLVGFIWHVLEFEYTLITKYIQTFWRVLCAFEV